MKIIYNKKIDKMSQENANLFTLSHMVCDVSTLQIGSISAADIYPKVVSRSTSRFTAARNYSISGLKSRDLKVTFLT